ncbi:MAG: indolepyruvate oxidoreductase subunit beta, partial [Phycisphaerae bacterium]|nr:indolepyruvate oxidoreductase subunit beta [Phycisphaerae bacterium]
METNLVLAGVGGQGILSIARALSDAAMTLGLQVKQAEVHGMSQRGGEVQSHLRLSDRAPASDLIPLGRADVVLAVEPLEALRYVQYLGVEGVVIANTRPVVNMSNYPPLEQVLDRIAGLPQHVLLDAEHLAQLAGTVRAANMVLLGAASWFVPLAPELIEDAVGRMFAAKGPQLADVNRRAFRLGREGGHSRARIAHSGGDATGAELERALLALVKDAKSIRCAENLFLLDLLDGDGEGVLGGLFCSEGGDLRVVRAGATVLATGGACRLYRESTNSPGATGDGMAAAYRAGAVLRDMEFVQFHPTVLYAAGAARFLITEAVRGAGARLVDRAGRGFMDAVHPQGDLAPRDVVVRGILRRLAETGDTHVFLDMTHLDPGEARRRFPGVFKTCSSVGLDPGVDPIPVRPSAHYFIGGVRTDLDGATNLPGLYACGEAASSGLHGANRLASNSLLEGLVLGERAGDAAGRSAATRAERKPAAEAL